MISIDQFSRSRATGLVPATNGRSRETLAPMNQWVISSTAPTVALSADERDETLPDCGADAGRIFRGSMARSSAPGQNHSNQGRGRQRLQRRLPRPAAERVQRHTGLLSRLDRFSDPCKPSEKMADQGC
jgi:hypothetical protein